MSTTTSKLAYLQSVDIFQNLTEGQMEDVAAPVLMFTCELGRVFRRTSEPAEVLFILKKGEVVRSRMNEDGKG
jgi:hypothetical protein